MDKKRVGLLSMAVALLAGVAITTTVWATYTTQLQVNGSGAVTGAKWEIKFSRLNTVSATQTATLGNTQSGVPSTATETTAPTIPAPTLTGDTSLGNFVVNLKTPGDYAEYEFDITNGGTFDAVIDSGFALPTPTCAPATPVTGTAATANEATTVCSRLSYTLVYADAPDNVGKGPAQGAAVAAGNLLEAGETRTVKLRLQYSAATTESELPSNDIDVTNLGFTITYNQA